MAEEPAVTKSFKLPKIFAEQLNDMAKSNGQSVSEYVRDLVVRELTREGDASLDEQNAEALKAIRALSNLLRGDVATLAQVMLVEVAKWDRVKVENWMNKVFNRAG